MRRVEAPVSLETARERIREYGNKHGRGPHVASALAEAIWPNTEWIATQGAGAAASRMLKRLGFQWTCLKDRRKWGWLI